MFLTLPYLQRECRDRGIDIQSEKRLTRQNLLDLLAQYTVGQRDSISWALGQRLRIVSPQLCFLFSRLRLSEREEILGSEDWIAEQKLDGKRVLLYYHPNEGFSVFSREVSEQDYLPIDYTDLVLLIYNGKVSYPSDFKEIFKFSFVLDTEAVIEIPNMDKILYRKYGLVVGKELNSVSAIMSLSLKESHRIQMEQAALRFKAFDILQLDGKNVITLPFRERRKLLERVVGHVQEKIPVSVLEWVFGNNKQKFFEQVVSEGSEGIVLKNLNAQYLITGSRSRKTQIKYKLVLGSKNGIE